MPKTLRLELPIKGPSMNEIWGSKHWSVRAAKAREIHDFVCLAVRSGKKVQFDACKITYMFHFKTARRRDLDNLAYGCKVMNDGLVLAGIIPDDNCAVVKELVIRANVGCES